jgi:hypothetical protein
MAGNPKLYYSYIVVITKVIGEPGNLVKGKIGRLGGSKLCRTTRDRAMSTHWTVPKIRPLFDRFKVLNRVG